MGQLHHGSGQSLPQGSVISHRAVAPLVQARAGGIQVQLYPVIHNGKLQLVLGPVFRQPGQAVLFSQPTGGGLFDNGLAVRYGHELAV